MTHHNHSPSAASLEALIRLAAIPGPSGWEGAVADWVERACRNLPGVETRRIGDLLLVARGRPRTAVVAHLDTTGFTLGYDGAAIPIGQADARGGEALRRVQGAGERWSEEATGRLEKVGSGLRIAGEGAPGSAWVYADPVREKGGVLTGPYLDNRAGVWIALRALELARDVVVAFTTAEERSGRGALVAARWLVERYGVRQAIISDITWDTSHVHCGHGPAISLRDRFMPRQAYLERVLALAEKSGLPFQRE